MPAARFTLTRRHFHTNEIELGEILISNKNLSKNQDSAHQELPSPWADGIAFIEALLSFSRISLHFSFHCVNPFFNQSLTVDIP